MITIKLDKQRYEKVIKDLEKYIQEAETWLPKMKMLVWDLKMAVEKDKDEEEHKQEFSS